MFQSPAFVRLWVARVFSKAGDNLSEVALAVFAFRASGNNPLAYGGVMAVSLATPIVFGWLAVGQLDRLHKQRVMIVMDVARAFLMLSIPVIGTLWWAFIAVMATQACASYYNPAVPAVLPETVTDAQILKANAALQNGMNAVDIPAYLVATGLVLKIGVGVAFAMDAVSFLIAALAVATMRLPLAAWLPRAAGEVSNFWADIREGVRYHRDTPLVWRLLLTYMIAAMGAYGLNVAIAAYVPEVLKAPVGQLGPILAGISLGGLIGSTWLDRWDPPHARFRALIAGGLGVMGLAVMGIVWVGTYPGAITLAVISGIGNVAAVIPLLTWIQITVPAAMRGRVLAARRMGLGLAGAVGSIAAGSAATRLGTPATLFALAGCLVIAAVIAWVGLHPERLAYRESASALSD